MENLLMTNAFLGPGTFYYWPAAPDCGAGQPMSTQFPLPASRDQQRALWLAVTRPAPANRGAAWWLGLAADAVLGRLQITSPALISQQQSNGRIFLGENSQ